MAETVGSLVDKLSIVGLKIWHMQEQVERKDATAEHKAACARKVEILQVQSADLQEELTELLSAVMGGRKRMKVYYQMKMYNDPKYRIPAPK